MTQSWVLLAGYQNIFPARVLRFNALKESVTEDLMNSTELGS